MREICELCIEPLRKRVIINNEKLTHLTKETLIHNDKIDKLEIVYFNRDTYVDPISGVSRPKNIFDTINEKFANHAANAREIEQDLQN